MSDPLDGVPTTPDPHTVVPAELVDTQVAVGDDHDHAEGRGLPVVRALGDAGAGWGLLPSGAIVLVRTLAEMVAWGAGWTQETSLTGRLPVGVGTSFSQPFAEATDYGSSWAHSHAGGDHAHTLSGHTHAGPSHTHDMQSHFHGMQNHTHAGGSHTHGMGHNHPVAITSSTNNPPGGIVDSGTGATAPPDGHTHTVSGNTGGPSADPTGGPTGSTSSGPNNNISEGPSNNTTTGGGTGSTGGPGPDATNTAGASAVTGNTSWLPPMRGVVYARKV